MNNVWVFSFLPGKAPFDKRGKHTNRTHKLKPELMEAIKAHISSFRGRKSHYLLRDSRKLYLPETLNIAKNYQMFQQKYSADYSVCYETYRIIFNTNFNIAFGYSRKDICSNCDAFIHDIKHKEMKLDQISENECEKETLKKELQVLRFQYELHLKKSEIFYKRKKEARENAKKNIDREAVVFYFQKRICQFLTKPAMMFITNDN